MTRLLAVLSGAVLGLLLRKIVDHFRADYDRQEP